MIRTMSHFDRTLLCELCSFSGFNSGLMVFYTGSNFPEFASEMLRDPLPIGGHSIDGEFALVLQHVIKANASVHDGAIMCGRFSAKDKYKVTGWSYRLHPPPINTPVVPNKGSAFNSSLAMSLVETVDRVLFWSSGRGWCFEDGSIVGPTKK